MPDHDAPPTPHFLRFARALALVSLVAASSAGCEQVRSAMGCQHCHCAGSSASIDRPLSCDLVGPTYCCAPIEGPLPPPDLPV